MSMSWTIFERSRANMPFPVVIILFLCMCSAGRARGDVVLYTASTDNSGGVDPVSVPNNNNPYIPSIDPSVTISPAQGGLLDGNTVGPLNGTTYGPGGWIDDTGGTTGFVNVSYTIATSGTFQLVWEVANTLVNSGSSALATDNVLLDGNSLFNFPMTGGLGALPTGLTGAGTYGTSGAITDLAPSGGDSTFAWIDTTGGLTPMYDTVDGNSASRLISTTFSATAGMVLSLDAAFLTNDGGPFDDYGIVVLVSVPEPSGLVLLLTGAVIGSGGLAARCRKRRAIRRQS
jgi:hypothetical protein